MSLASVYSRPLMNNVGVDDKPERDPVRSVLLHAGLGLRVVEVGAELGQVQADLLGELLHLGRGQVVLVLPQLVLVLPELPLLLGRDGRFRRQPRVGVLRQRVVLEVDANLLAELVEDLPQHRLEPLAVRAFVVRKLDERDPRAGVAFHRRLRHVDELRVGRAVALLQRFADLGLGVPLVGQTRHVLDRVQRPPARLVLLRRGEQALRLAADRRLAVDDAKEDLASHLVELRDVDAGWRCRIICRTSATGPGLLVGGRRAPVGPAARRRGGRVSLGGALGAGYGQTSGRRGHDHEQAHAQGEPAEFRGTHAAIDIGTRGDRVNRASRESVVRYRSSPPVPPSGTLPGFRTDSR